MALDTTTDSSYVLLTVWTTGDLTGDASITYPDTVVIPDNTDTVMRAWRIGASGTDRESFQGYNASHVYRFFKLREKDTPSIGNFSVRIGTMDATVSTPGSTN